MEILTLPLEWFVGIFFEPLEWKIQARMLDYDMYIGTIRPEINSKYLPSLDKVEFYWNEKKIDYSDMKCRIRMRCFVIQRVPFYFVCGLQKWPTEFEIEKSMELIQHFRQVVWLICTNGRRKWKITFKINWKAIGYKLDFRYFSKINCYCKKHFDLHQFNDVYRQRTNMGPYRKLQNSKP